MHTRDRTGRLAIACALTLAAACARSGFAAFPIQGYGDEVRDGVARIRAATARFASIDSAVAAGYPHDAPQCYANGAAGAMGFHHVNRSYLQAHLDLERPQILIYERHPNGLYTLNAVEFIIPFALWPADSVAPVLLGQHLKRYDDLQIWSIHVWLWKQNPSGLFADWNPTVHCPDAAATMVH